MATNDQPDFDSATLVVRDAAMKELMETVERVAGFDAAVLVIGETGTGKEVIARSLHHFSRRRDKPFIDINCAALPEHLVESELFGYEKGAFSGADSCKPGLFEMANSGTLFLDEIGELDAKVQVKLLRVLDGVPYYRLGGNRKVAVDVRIIAATNRDLEAAIKAGRFRSDLFHRLSQFQLHVPPLRTRPDDLIAIAEFALHHHYPDSHFAPDAIEVFLRYPWPGNVRELQNVVFKTVLMAKNGPVEIRASDLPRYIVEAAAGISEVPPAATATVGTSTPELTDLDAMQRAMILKVLERTGGNQVQAAEQLGISRRTLSRKLKSYRAELGKLPVQVPADDSLHPRNSRRNVQIPIRVRCEGGSSVSAVAINVSYGGMGIYMAEGCGLEPHSNVEVMFTLPGGRTLINLSAEVMWADASGFAGLRFQQVPATVQSQFDSWIDSQARPN